MRILHIIPQLGVGGTERIVADLMRQQRITDEPKLCVLGSANGNSSHFGATVDRYLGFSGSLRDLQGITRCIDELHQTICEIRPSMIHAHLWPAALFAIPAAEVAGIGCIVHVHDSQPWLASGRIRDGVLRLIHGRRLKSSSVRTLAVSRAVKDYTIHNLRCRPDGIRVVHNGINVDHFRRMHEHSENGKISTIGSVGRLEPEKGFIHLIHAARELRKRGFDFCLHIAGEGSQRVMLESLIQSLGLTDAIRLIGVARDVHAFYEQLDLFILPSVAAEGLPLTILEAMAMEIPVIATAIAGAPEVIGFDGSRGRLVPPSDPIALANSMQEIIEDRHSRNAMGRRARMHVESCFTIEQMTAQVRNSYLELLN